MAIRNSTISTTETDIFVCPGVSQEEHAVTCIIFCNVSALDSTLDLYVIPNGEVLASKHQIIKTLAVAATDTVTFDTEKIILSTGDRIVAKSEIDASIVCTVSSMRVS